MPTYYKVTSIDDYTKIDNVFYFGSRFKPRRFLNYLKFMFGYTQRDLDISSVYIDKVFRRGFGLVDEEED